MGTIDIDAATKAARDVVFKVAQEGKLHELTPKQVRNKVEEQLGLKQGALDDYKKKLKAVMESTVAEVQAGVQASKEKAGTEDKDVKPKPKSKGSKSTAKPNSSSKTSPSKEKVEKKTDASKATEKKSTKSAESKRRKRKSAEERDESKPKAKAKKAKIANSDEESEAEAGPSKAAEKKPSSKAKKGDDKVIKSKETIESSDDDGNKDEGSSQRSKKHATPRKPTSSAKSPVASKANIDEKGKEKVTVKPKSHEQKEAKSVKEEKVKDDADGDAEKSESELSELIDEPPKKKRGRKSKDIDDSEPKAKKSREKSIKPGLSPDEEQVKKLKALVFACGVRKVWARELKDLDTPSRQISYIRGVLSELGMKGRFSMEQAKAIKAKRELAQEMEDVREFAEKHAMEGRASRSKTAKQQADNAVESDADDADENSESEGEVGKPRQRNARQSIMAFLQDQSDSD